MTNSNLIVGYDYDAWYGYGIKEPIYTDISRQTNSHFLITGLSGSGKSYFENLLLARLSKAGTEIYFADFKQDDSFKHLRDCNRYYPFDKTTDALDIVYDTLHRRQSGVDKKRTSITLIWDEYVANILSIQNTNKKEAEKVMRKVSEILMLGRSLGVRLIITCQRPDASAFPTGSRINFGIIMILGASNKSIYEMLIPKDFIDEVDDRKFGTGEGIVLLQGSELRFIKVPMVRDNDKLQTVCREALMRDNKDKGGCAVGAKPHHWE